MPKITIALSERRPVTIDTEDWPVVAEAKRCLDHKDLHIKVRQHKDGRRIVSGVTFVGECAGFLVDNAVLPRSKGGPLAPDEAETVRSIRRVGGILKDDKLASECIANLPAEDLS